MTWFLRDPRIQWVTPKKACLKAKKFVGLPNYKLKNKNTK